MTGLPYAPALAAYAEGQRILMRDWSQHMLGALEHWDEGLFAALANMLPLSVPAAIVWGPAARLFFNAAFERTFTDRSLVQGQALGDPEDSLWKALINYRNQGEERAIEVKGIAGWWQVIQSPLSDRDGDIKGRQVQLHSINALKLAEQALQASEETLLTLMDRQPSFLWRSDPWGRPIWINRRGREFLGLDKGAAVPASETILPTPDLAILMSEIQTQLTRRQSFDIHLRVKPALGTARWCLLHFAPLSDGRGRVHAWSGSGVDIEQWHAAATRAARALDSGDTADAAIASAPAIDRYGRGQFGWIADVETGLLRALNPRSGQEWGMSRDGPPVLWADWLMSLPVEERERADDVFARAGEGKVADDIWSVTGGDGEIRPVHVMAFPIPDDDGVIRRIGGVLIPSSQLKDQRVYLVDCGRDAMAARPDMRRALSTLGVKVRVFDSFETFAVVQDDLRRGLVVVRLEQSTDELTLALPMLARNREHFPWMVVTDYSADVRDVVEIMRHGATTVLSPTATRVEIASAISSGLPSRAEEPSSQVEDHAERLSALSTRERQVLEGLLAGGTNKTIAAQLQLSPRTVETHRAHLMDRLGAKSLAELLRIAQKGAA